MPPKATLGDSKRMNNEFVADAGRRFLCTPCERARAAILDVEGDGIAEGRCRDCVLVEVAHRDAFVADIDRLYQSFHTDDGNTRGSPDPMSINRDAAQLQPCTFCRQRPGDLRTVEGAAFCLPCVIAEIERTASLRIALAETDLALAEALRRRTHSEANGPPGRTDQREQRTLR